MAGQPGLKPSPAGFRLLAIAAGVLLAHGLALDWLARHQLQPSLLQRVVDPMFTRVLQPEAPPPVVAAATVAPAPAPRPAITGITATPSTPEGTRTVADKPRKERKPEPSPAPVEEAKEQLAQQQPPAADEATPAAPPEPTPPGPAPTTETEQRATADPAMAAQVPDPASAPQAAAPAPAGDATSAAQAAPSPAPAASAPTEALDGWPRDSRLSYSLTGQYRGGPLYGEAQVQWQRQGALYQARVQLDISLAGSRVMTSQGDVTPGGLVPRVYEEARGKRLRSVRLNDREVVLSDGRTLPRPPGVQDTASQFVELGHRFATGRETLAVGRPVQVWLARPGGLDLWTYDVVALERLKTPGYGEVEAFRLTPRPLPNPRGNITAEIWFAPTLQYLPVRIRVSTGEEAWVDLLVEAIEQR